MLNIPNPSGLPNLVVLFPVTRIGPTAISAWDKLILTINTSDVYALVVIDKTGNGSANEYFTNRIDEIRTMVHILIRDSTEPIFDSQKYIALDRMLWIQQLHDDDSWQGQLRIPESAEERDLFLTDFYTDATGSWVRVDKSDTVPARIVFSAVPAIIWNRFSSFIFAQGGHVAGSVDSTISTVAQLSCDFRELPSFTYFYSTHHWANRSDAEAHLKNLSYMDGWGDLASADVAILNRNFDNLSALFFFQDLFQNSSIVHAQKSLLSSFQPSIQRRGYLMGVYILKKYFLIPLFAFFASLGFKFLEPKIEEYKKTSTLNALIIASWRAKSVSQILEFFDHTLISYLPSELQLRLDFWRKQLTSSQPNIR